MLARSQCSHKTSLIEPRLWILSNDKAFDEIEKAFWLARKLSLWFGCIFRCGENTVVILFFSRKEPCFLPLFSALQRPDDEADLLFPCGFCKSCMRDRTNKENTAQGKFHSLVNYEGISCSNIYCSHSQPTCRMPLELSAHTHEPWNVTFTSA